MKNAMIYKMILIVGIILLSLFTSCKIIKNPESIKLVSTYTTRIIPVEYKKSSIQVHSGTICLRKSMPKEDVIYDIFHTKEYKVYNGLKSEADVLNTAAENDLTFADELKLKAMKCSYASQQLIDSSERVTDRKEKIELLKRAEWMDKAFIKFIALSDSIREVGRNSDAAWYSRRVEAELYIQSVDQERYDQVMALYDILDVQKTRTMAMNDTKAMEK